MADRRSFTAPGAPDPGSRVPDEPRRRLDAASLRRLVRLARPEAARIAGGTVFLLLGAVSGLLYPQGMRLIIDSVIGAGPARPLAETLRAIDWLALVMAGLAVVQGVSAAVRYVLFSTAGERIVTTLRQDLYRAILDQEIAFFDTRRTGELTSRLSSDTATLQNTVSVNVSMALRFGAQIVGGIVFLFYTSPILTALMLAVVPAVALGAVTYGRKVRKLARDFQDALAKGGEIADESIAGVRTVRSFAAEPAEVRRYSAALDAALALARRRIRAGGAFMALASSAAFGAASLVFWYGGRLVARHEMTVGGLTSFLIYTMFVAFALGGLADLWADFMRSLGAAERVFEILDRKPAMALGGGERLAAPSGAVALEGVRFAYPTRPEITVLDGVDLRVAPGEIVALVGPSGAGKSTVAALVARLYDPREGSVRFDGHDVRTLDPTWLRQQIGVVAQEPILFSTTIAANIRYGRPDASDAEVEAAARAANAHGFITAFPQGYQTEVGERGIQLSGGQKQRVAIARAVLKDPRLLVLDEATSALDAESEHLVKEALDRLMRTRTTLVIAHRLSTVKDAHRVVVVEGGRIVQSGPHESLLAEEGLYRRLVERQFVAA